MGCLFVSFNDYKHAQNEMNRTYIGLHISLRTAFSLSLLPKQ